MYLSNIELFYIPQDYFAGNKIVITGDEFKHLTNVMRRKQGDEVYITGGEGKIYKCVLETVVKKQAVAVILETTFYINENPGLIFCLPLLQNADRLEFAFEKCIELGITNFIFFEAERSYRKGDKSERWLKIAAAAMKQSLRSFMPGINYKKSIAEIAKLEGGKILFDQNADAGFGDLLKSNKKEDLFPAGKNYYFIFGPEGGLSDRELEHLKDSSKYKLTGNRLRAETAVITAASLVTIIQ
ncbi:MAG: 16S rRNA (uracil(1498)-N(3))-methyltransferase [Bacteroidetes bacterium]|nr:16S rRNA (uracil(1498)-N(3))-methyltransferase [Bacteroidota bacterium]